MSAASLSRLAASGVVHLVRTLASADAALLVEALIFAWRETDAVPTLLPAPALAAFDPQAEAVDAPTALERLQTAQREFAGAFGFDVIRFPRALEGDGFCSSKAASLRIEVDPVFAGFLHEALPAAGDTDAPFVDAATKRWVNAVIAAAEHGNGAHHFLLRLSPSGPSSADFAALVAAAGRQVVRIVDEPRNAVSLILRAELHVGRRRPVIIAGAGAETLLVASTPNDADDDFMPSPAPAAPSTTTLGLAPGVRPLLPVFGSMQAVYVWAIPHEGAVPPELDGIAAGCIGPLVFDGRCYDALNAFKAPELGPAALAALRAMVHDPRKVAAALAATKAFVAGNAMPPDDAAMHVARSHGVRLQQTRVAALHFDPSLLMADVDIDEVLERAEHLARGGRILLHGPPAGGKTAFALALCARMLAAPSPAGAREASLLCAGDILASKWGATERLLNAKFADAAAAGDVPVFVDEFDAFAGVRETGGSNSNNGYLVRSLTDEILRVLDSFPSVPVIAAANDLRSIDGAARRRFHLVIEVADELSPDRERRAWTSILGIEPPDDWTPVGAAVGDVATAALRCRMLGRTDRASFVDAIRRARTARLGIEPSATSSRRSLH